MTAIQRSKLTWMLLNFVSTSTNGKSFIVELDVNSIKTSLDNEVFEDTFFKFFDWFPNKMEINKKDAVSEKDAARIYIASILDWIAPQHILMSEIE